ncbi:NAD(P)H-dependent oxidoreductase [Synechococcus sp. CS-1325]|uniref:NADPH-dependent FMN reductase n=1 Tax=unclassified Synechococcus TaxID=2626047 RepID=UPI000DB07E27|nr:MULTISPECIES: NAD(P)H-dependent oxidoreductase [unclassified Synechococcus]MCT0200815.1 NAD(P)H-dependent oxidoreductase [Synechococcus sp. CS-1325]MCT0230755.1 NAD(P)H-dependent oxidoreductase [Synechococcus sp. CS-1324]PZU98720.1 MAG: NADPH-dependent oxidoreductase [Cyanobium sp.]PZV05912.1 MAG: NADPH-dependent oxidoreductase [Cyanobium sp.]
MLVLAASNGKNLELARQILLCAESNSEANAAAGSGAAELIDLVALNLPLFTPVQQPQGAGPGLEQLASALRRHRRLWVCAPEYNGSLPPTLVNAVAWLSTSTADFRNLFQGIPVALASHSGGSSQKVLSGMRLQFSHLGAVVIGRELHSNSQKGANPESIAAMLAELHRLEAPPLA